jgi:hypothetical protein
MLTYVDASQQTKRCEELTKSNQAEKGVTSIFTIAAHERLGVEEEAVVRAGGVLQVLQVLQDTDEKKKAGVAGVAGVVGMREMADELGGGRGDGGVVAARRNNECRLQGSVLTCS